MTSQSSLHMLSLRPFISDLLELVMNDHCNMSTLLSLTAWQVSLGTGDIAHVDGVNKVGQTIKGDESSFFFPSFLCFAQSNYSSCL